MDLDLHKRKIFIQGISPETTKKSLEDYFSKYSIQWCAVPLDETGKNKMHGIVVFRDEESVDTVMSQRLHRIDGKEVFIHRSVPTERSSKDNYGIQQLIVSGLNNKSLLESNIRSHFSPYGEICNISKMNNDDNIWIIDFD
jgi:RNA recognition motif-containing protein